jgi:hypothetical protein
MCADTCFSWRNLLFQRLAGQMQLLLQLPAVALELLCRVCAVH